MAIWEGAEAVLFERSSDGQTATVLGAGDAVLAKSDDAGNVVDAQGAPLMTASFSEPRGAGSDRPGGGLKKLKAQVEVASPDGTPAGALGVRKFSVGPFSRKLTIVLRDPAGEEIGKLSNADRKGKELAVTVGGATVANLAQVERDRGIKRTVERWSLRVEGRPEAPNDLLAAAAILRYNKMLAAVSAPSHG